VTDPARDPYGDPVEELAGGPPGRPWPGWVRPVAGVAVLAVVVVGGWQSQRGTPDPAPTPTRAPRPSAAAEPSRAPVDFTGLPPSGRTGIRLLVSGTALREVELDTGWSRPIAGIPESPTGYRLTRTDGGTVIAQSQPACDDCRSMAYLVPPRSYTARAVTGYDGVVPAAEPDRVWGYREYPTEPSRPGVVQLLDLAGRPKGPAYPLPPERLVRRGTVGGLVLAHCCDPTAELWDPVSGTVLRALGTVLAATATRIVWADPPCVLDCPVRLTDLARHTDKQVEVHADGLSHLEIQTMDRTFDGAAIGPDSEGGLVALLVPRRPGPGSAGPTQDLFLLSADGTTRVAASTLSVEARPTMIWAGPRLLLAQVYPSGAAPVSLATTTAADPRLRRIPAPALTGYALVVR
jgi:hypothetical protein